MASNLPDYVASAQPVPLANRVPWYKSTAQTYAGIMLWFVFWHERACHAAARWSQAASGSHSVLGHLRMAVVVVVVTALDLPLR